jgi:asparagine synthase (glutamine-hydrolysing)
VAWREWALRFAMGWFPRDTTGFHNLRFAPPGAQWKITTAGRRQTRFEVLSDWLHPSPMSRDDALDLALTSVRDQVRALRPLCDQPSVGLSGGWDSRIVVAALRAEGVICDLRVRGLPDRPDVKIARRLAEIARLDLRVKSLASLPPAQPDQCRAAIERALRWQAGGMVTRQHKVFLAAGKLLDGGRVNVLGQHGEIARGFYARKIAAAGTATPSEDEGLIQWFRTQIGPAFLPEVQTDVGEIVQAVLRDASRRGLAGDSRLDYFFLTEDTRRWASASLASQTGVTCTPLLTPGFIHATFALAPQDRRAHAIPRHILSACAPDWLDVPFAEAAEKPTTAPALPADWQRPAGRHNYDNVAFWRTVGWPLLTAAIEQGAGAGEIFDLRKVEEHWAHAADELVIASLLPEVFPP